MRLLYRHRNMSFFRIKNSKNKWKNVDICVILMIMGGRMKKIVVGTIFVIYIIITLFVTICLINYNQFGFTEFGNKVIILAGKANLKDYKKSDLLLITKSKTSDYKVDDEVFYYASVDKKIQVNKKEIVKIEPINKSEKNIIFENDNISSDYVIGKKENTKVFPLIGYVLMALTSKKGYLFGIILPVFLIFIYETYSIFVEIKKK